MIRRKDRRPAADSDSALGDVLEFMRVIWALDHAVQRTSKWMERELGVTGPQRLVLRVVGRFPGIPAGHLAQILHVHPSTLTGVLRRLERQRMLRRRSDPRDGRRSLLGLTGKGRAFDVEAEGTIEAAVQRVMARADADKLEAAREVLHSITSTLHAAGAERGPPPRERSSRHGQKEQPADRRRR